MLSRILESRSSRGIHALAISSASLLFAVLAVFVLPAMSGWPQLLQVLTSAVSLAVIVTAIEYTLVRVRAKRVLGEWVYLSSSGNWARAEIKSSSGGLSYKVLLFRTREDLIASENLWAVGEGTSVSYEGGNLYIRYEVKLTSPDYVPRDGFLVLVPDLADSTKMTGFWSRTSHVDSAETRGILTFSRAIPDPVQ